MTSAQDDLARAFRLAPQEYDPAIDLDAIREHPDNPNVGASEVIAESLDRFGFIGAIVVHKATGNILAGNHRFREAQARNAETIPGFWLDVDEETARQWMITDNDSTRRGQWVHAKLLALLKPMSGLPPGFTQTRVEDLVRLLNPPDLEGLARDAPPEEDMWPMLRFRVSPEDRERFYELTDPAEDKTDTGRLVFLLDQVQP